MTHWNGATALIIGAARQGLALARYLVGQGAHVIINDQNPSEKLSAARAALAGLPVEWVCGSHPLELLDRADRVCVSGGVPLTLPILQEAFRRGLPVTNDSQIFMEEVSCPVIGITGSSGKTTTTTLVGRMAEAAVQAPHKAWVGGNIGRPLIDHVHEIQPSDLVILELSSFQLELMTRSPQIAAVTNITPNHLDRHGTMEAYTRAKARILDFQGANDCAVLCREDPGSWALAAQAHGKLSSYGFAPPPAGTQGTYWQAGKVYFHQPGASPADSELFAEAVIGLRGMHNRLNAIGASAIGIEAGFPAAALAQAIDGFHGAAHRLELVREWNGALWYNSSIDTAPERTIASVRVFNEPMVLLLGGRDKNLPWEGLAALIHERVEHVVLFGEAAGLIKAAIGAPKSGRKPYSLVECAGLQDAVQAAAQVAQKGSVVLLSPGGTSYDEFKDFEERGECFRLWVKQLL
jgi:UDP-N-acetylmuramoylalanine--D-glutamate ligase